MATYTAQKALNGKGPAARVEMAGYQHAVYSSYTLPAAPANGDIIQMLRVPRGARIVGCTLKATDLDSGGSPAIVLAVGDTGDNDRLLTASTVGQTGGTDSSLVSGTGRFYAYADETTISITVTTGPATGAAGTVELLVEYVIQ